METKKVDGFSHTRDNQHLTMFGFINAKVPNKKCRTITISCKKATPPEF